MDAEAALAAALRELPHVAVVRVAPATLIVRRIRPPPPPDRARAAPPSARADPGSVPAEPPPPDIIVTAARRSSLLQRYPGSLTVVRGAAIEQDGRRSLAQISPLAPGLQLTETGTGQRRITMRGLHSAGENSVLLYLDETPISGPSSATSDVSQMSPDLRLLDIDRVEVLRGPQGTLFGSGAMSGAIRIVTNAPDATRAYGSVLGSASWAAGSARPGRLVSGVANLPLGETTALRLLAYDEARAGHVDNVATGRRNVDRAHTSGVRAALRSDLGDGFDVTAGLTLQRQRVADASTWYAALGRDRSDTAVRLPFPNDFMLAGLTAHARLDEVMITASASRYRWRATRVIDSTRPALRVIEDATYCPAFAAVETCSAEQEERYRAAVRGLLPLVGIQPMKVIATVGELRAATPEAAPLSVVGGLFLEHRQDGSRSGTFRADAVTGAPFAAAAQTFLRTVSVRTDQRAAFADLAWRLTPRVRLTVGGRYYRYAKRAIGQVVQGSVVNGAVAGPAQTLSTRSDGVIGRVNLAVDLSASTLAFFQVADGFRPGGLNTVPTLPPSLVMFDADRARSTEIGLRMHRWDGRLTVSAALYNVDWRDIQSIARVPSFIFVSNAGSARIVGADLDVEGEPLPGLRLRVAANLLDARLRRDQINPVVPAPGRRGDHVPSEPGITALVGGSYSWRAGEGQTLSLGGDVNYVGRSCSEFRPTGPYCECMGRYAIASFRARIDQGSWGVSLLVNNAFDTVARQRVESSVGSEQLVHAAPRRTVQLEISRKIGRYTNP